MHLSMIPIDINRINRALADNRFPKPTSVEKILQKARGLSGIDMDEAATLLNLEDEELLNRLFETSGWLKGRIYGKRIVLFAPLYLSNECHNNCLYCGFRRDNLLEKRRTLTPEEAAEEAKILEGLGYKRLLLVTSEGPDNGPNYLAHVIKHIYKETGIRILHINAPPFSIEEFKRLKEAGAGVYQSFQETYHPETYNLMHPSGRKSDYHWRTGSMERAIEAGFDDIGMGVLLGLYDYRFEALSLIMHAKELEKRYGFGPHTVSVPRLQPAFGALIREAPYPVSDTDFKKIVAVYRLSLPYVGIVVSTREKETIRNEVIRLGASQISAGSRTAPGGYGKERCPESEQFVTEDHRPLSEVINDLILAGSLPSLCTSCYRIGRTGIEFRRFADRGDIQQYCLPNALLTLQEYLEDHAPSGLKKAGGKLINDHLDSIEDSLFKTVVEERLERIKRGERDIYY